MGGKGSRMCSCKCAAYRDISIRKKYNNILQCEENYSDMQDACSTLNGNVAKMHEALLALNSECLEEIASEL